MEVLSIENATHTMVEKSVKSIRLKGLNCSKWLNLTEHSNLQHHPKMFFLFFFDWQVWDSFLLLVGGIMGYNITYNIYHNRIKMVSQDGSISPNTHRIWWTHLSWVVSTVFFTVPFRRNKHGILKPSQNCRNPESWYSGVFEYIEH